MDWRSIGQTHTHSRAILIAAERHLLQHLRLCVPFGVGKGPAADGGVKSRRCERLQYSSCATVMPGWGHGLGGLRVGMMGLTLLRPPPLWSPEASLAACSSSSACNHRHACVKGGPLRQREG